MEQLLNDNIYLIDLSGVNTPPEIIYELSSVLDNEEAENRKISLRIGNVDLNQAQLLSIKALINGTGSILACIETKSVETEKTALSLGFIVSNVSQENIIDAPEASPYKTADELKKEFQSDIIETQNADSDIYDDDEIVEESDLIQREFRDNEIVENEEDFSFLEIKEEEPLSNEHAVPGENVETIEDKNENLYRELPDEHAVSKENVEIIESKNENSNQELPCNHAFACETTGAAEEIAEQTQKTDGEPDLNIKNANAPAITNIKDELDVIFDSSTVKKNIFNLKQNNGEDDGLLDDMLIPKEEYTREDIEIESLPVKYIKQTIRSGQVVNFEGNMVIIGDCHPGSEITASGDISVWGVLSGIAHAGAGGNRKARVRALKMNAIQLRIADCYSRRPDSFNTVCIEKTNSFTPEEARIVNSEIVVFKMND